MINENRYTIRKARPKDGEVIARVQVKTWQAVYADIFPADKLAGMEAGLPALAERWRSNIRAPDRFPAFFVVTDHSDEVFGFAAGSRQPKQDYPFETELQVIYLLPEYHRKGIGRKLMSAVAAELLEAGFASMILWVLKDNHQSRLFYERLGGQLVGESAYERWDETYSIVAYGWEDLKTLLSHNNIGRSQ